MAGQDGFAGYAILELMGHRKLAGFVQELQLPEAATGSADTHDGYDEYDRQRDDEDLDLDDDELPL